MEGDGQVSAPGARLPRPLVVEVTDETGARIDDVIVSFRVPEDGITGTFHNGLKTEILRTGEDGRAELRSLVMGGLAGQFQVRLTVAKGEARAGIVSTQFIAPDGRRHLSLRVGSWHPRGRVLEIGAVILAAAAAGYLKNASGGGAAKATLPPVIGPPVVTVGKP